MILVNGAPVGIHNAQQADAFQVNISSLLYLPQSGFPENQEPPAGSPYDILYQPGTLRWPVGASNFSVGQYILSQAEVNAIWPSGLTPGTVTLTLGTVTFTLYPLQLFPLSQAHYLLVLVDGRYFFQTKAPNWSITPGTTTWTNLDSQLNTYLSAFGGTLTADVVPAAYLNPSASLAPPALASTGTLTMAGPLIDLIGQATGRRFVSLPNGNYAFQLPATAAAADATQQANALPNKVGYQSSGTSTIFVVPGSITAVYPQVSGGVEVAPFTVNTTFASQRVAAGYLSTDTPIQEGAMQVGMELWYNGSNGATLTTHANRWSQDWWAWLRGLDFQTYAGAQPYTPNAYNGEITWNVQEEMVWTRVLRGVVNPRPSFPVQGFSGVTAPGVSYPSGINVTGPATFGGPVTINGGITLNNFPVYTPSTTISMTADINNMVLPGSSGIVVLLPSAGNWNFTGITAGTPGERVVFINEGSVPILVRDQSASSTAANRITTWTENDVWWPPDHWMEFIYDGTLSCWRCAFISDPQNHRVKYDGIFTTTQNDYANAAGNPCVRFQLGANVYLTGIANGTPGQVIYLANWNNGAPINQDWLVLRHQNTGSAVGNRFTCPAGIDYPIAAGGGVVLYYDGNTSEWKVLANSPFPVITLMNDVALAMANPPPNPPVQFVIQHVAPTAPRALTLPPSSQFPAGSQVVYSDPAALITAANNIPVGPFSGDKIKGSASSYTIKTPGTQVVFVTDGAGNWSVLDPAGGGATVATQAAPTQTVSGVATVTFALSGYKVYKLFISDLQCSLASQSLMFRTSSNGGVSYDSGASDYQTTSGGTADSISPPGFLPQTGTASNVAACELTIFDPAAASIDHLISFLTFTSNPPGNTSGYGVRLSTSAIDHIEVLASAGNLSGTFTLYGFN